MEKYFAVTYSENTKLIVSKVMSQFAQLLSESNHNSEYALGEDDDNQDVLMMSLPDHATELQANQLAESLANKLFDQGLENFNLYFSTNENLNENLNEPDMSSYDINTDINPKPDFDIVDDIVVFMRNDPHFYRRHYYPKMVSVTNEYKKNNTINRELFAEMLETAIPVYLDKFDIPNNPNDVFTKEDKNAIVDAIIDEESNHIQNKGY